MFTTRADQDLQLAPTVEPTSIARLLPRSVPTESLPANGLHLPEDISLVRVARPGLAPHGVRVTAAGGERRCSERRGVIAYGVWVNASGFRPVQSARTFEAVVDQLAEAIRTGELRRGEKLPAERALAARLEVSRPTLREALRVLAHAGVVEIRPGAAGGTFVISETIPASLMVRTESRLAEIPAVLEARRLFEPAVAQLASRRASVEDVEGLRRIVALQREAADDWPQVTQLDIRFHREIARIAGNPVIVAMMNTLSRQLEIARATRVAGPSAVEAAIAANEETADAIANGDEHALEEVMDRHLKLLENAWSDASAS